MMMSRTFPQALSSAERASVAVFNRSFTRFAIRPFTLPNRASRSEISLSDRNASFNATRSAPSPPANAMAFVSTFGFGFAVSDLISDLTEACSSSRASFRFRDFACFSCSSSQASIFRSALKSSSVRLVVRASFSCSSSGYGSRSASAAFLALSFAFFGSGISASSSSLT
jgi:hypothetical protein